jgi:hypothetical protein
MARRTNRQKEETISIVYGINPQNFEVETVFVTRDGTIRKHGRRGLRTQVIAPGRQAHSEIATVFGLIDVFETHPQFGESESTRRKLHQLRAKAAAMAEAVKRSKKE